MYHYFDKDIGPFKNLSELSYSEAAQVVERIRQDGSMFASRRSNDYMQIRRELEAKARDQFIAIGGRPRNSFPHYMTLGACEWLETWYRKPATIVIPWNDFADESISFTYGDLFPTMRYVDDKPYRKQIHTKNEIKKVIDLFGFPQDWNKDGDKGPERYIEVQVWDNEVIKKYCE